jgi:beta-mannosidase
LKEHDDSRPYTSTSPTIGWGHAESYTQGDSHYWGVWAGLEDIENFNIKYGRFTSEYGMQGMPCMNSVKKFSLPEDWSLESPVMLLHERHPS